MKQILFILLFFSIIFAGVVTPISSITDEIISLLGNGNSVVSITAIDRDRRFGLPLSPVIKLIKRELLLKKSNINISSLGSSSRSIVNTVVMGANNREITINEQEIDSLILFGNFIIDKDKSLYLQISISNLLGTIIYESDEVKLIPKSLPHSFYPIFDKINNHFDAIKFRGEIIEKFDQLFSSVNSNLLEYPANYRFINSSPYAFSWQVDIIKEILSLKYGISFTNSENTITINQNRVLIIRKNGITHSISDICDGKSLFKNIDKGNDSTLLFISKNGDGSVLLEEERLSPLAIVKIRDRVKDIFEVDYPNSFKNFNIENIKPYFSNKQSPTILTGSLESSNSNSGEEIVRYKWYRASDWLNALEKLNKSGREFQVKTSLIKLFGDCNDNNRYWAIIKQNWRTTLNNRTVYTDNGFLFVNFDFDSNLNIKNFIIHYRLWFYDYKYDRIVDGVVIESRGQKLKRDLDSIFLKSITGIDKNLKMGMIKYLVGRVENHY